jgi:hypothetical protein
VWRGFRSGGFDYLLRAGRQDGLEDNYNLPLYSTEALLDRVESLVKAPKLAVKAGWCLGACTWKKPLKRLGGGRLNPVFLTDGGL